MSRFQTRTLLLAGVVGPVLFVSTFLLEGALRPGYDPTRQFVSLLSLGPGGWIQVLNFVATGLLIALFGVGLGRTLTSGVGRRWLPRLVVVVGAALAWCGVFLADPALGYPPGAIAGVPMSASWHASLHYVGAVVVFVGLAGALLIGSRRATRTGSTGLAAYSLASAMVVLGGWIGAFAVAGPGTLDVAGLLQRVAIVAGMQWLVVVAIMELRTARVGSLVPSSA